MSENTNIVSGSTDGDEREDVDNNSAVDEKTADVSIVSSQTQGLTSPCSGCGKLASKKEHVFDCSKCPQLTHFTCSKLPAYAIYSIKSSKRQYVCASCSCPPAEYVQLYDQVKDEEKTTTKEVISDVFAEIKRVGDSVSKFDLETMMETLQERARAIDSIDTKLEVKIKAMETRIVEKLSSSMSSLPIPTSTAVPCECEHLKRQLTTKESEVSLLQDELKEADKRVVESDRRLKEATMELKNLKAEKGVICKNLSESSSSLESFRLKNEELGR